MKDVEGNSVHGEDMPNSGQVDWQGDWVEGAEGFMCFSKIGLWTHKELELYVWSDLNTELEIFNLIRWKFEQEQRCACW